MNGFSIRLDGIMLSPRPTVLRRLKAIEGTEGSDFARRVPLGTFLIRWRALEKFGGEPFGSSIE